MGRSLSGRMPKVSPCSNSSSLYSAHGLVSHVATAKAIGFVCLDSSESRDKTPQFHDSIIHTPISTPRHEAWHVYPARTISKKANGELYLSVRPQFEAFCSSSTISRIVSLRRRLIMRDV